MDDKDEAVNRTGKKSLPFRSLQTSGERKTTHKRDDESDGVNAMGKNEAWKGDKVG